MREPRFWNADTPGARVLRGALAPVGALYGASVGLKRMTARPMRPHARVLCIGNLTVGGTGKTPLAIALARMLEIRGCKVGFLTRGYGGKEKGPVLADPIWHTAADVGDEALVLAGTARTIVAHDRAQGANFGDRNRIDVLIMDDGFQNFDIVKDASIVVIDSEVGFGNGRMVPAGPMREGLSGLERATAIVLMGEAPFSLPAARVPVIRAHIMPADRAALAGRRAVAFAGIGRPEKFFNMLLKSGVTVARRVPFPDHHVFSPDELRELIKLAFAEGAELMTTEKDYFRLRLEQREGIVPVPAGVVFDDQKAINRILDLVMPEYEEPMR